MGKPKSDEDKDCMFEGLFSRIQWSARLLSAFNCAEMISIFPVPIDICQAQVVVSACIRSRMVGRSMRDGQSGKIRGAQSAGGISIDISINRLRCRFTKLDSQLYQLYRQNSGRQQQ